MRNLLVAGTGTGVGKTLVTAALCYQLTTGGHCFTAFKPVITGFSHDDNESDSALLLRACRKPVTREAIESISPWRYEAPLSPHLAAPAGSAPSAKQVAAFCRSHEAAGAVIVEGAGGIMTPINGRETFLDIARALGYPVMLVAGSYLGAISHTLTALTALQSAGVSVQAVIVSASEAGVSLADTAESIRAFAGSGIAFYTVPRIDQPGETWRHLPPLSQLCLS